MKAFALFSLNLLFFLIFNLASCKAKKDFSGFQRSERKEVDIFMIPEKFNIMESEWVETSTISSFAKSDLIRHLKSYGRTLNDLQNNPDTMYSENDGIVKMKVKKTSHSTGFYYDVKIPIVFYGPKWFKQGEYHKEIHQQHIVPTLAKILNIRNPNGVVTHPLLEIYKDQNNPEKPEIIVTVVIDQGGQQLYRSHPDVSENISKIKKESAYFPNAEVGHLDAHTAVGHAAIGTGAYPSKNLVIGNTYYYYNDRKVTYKDIYSQGNQTNVDLSELAVESLSDVLDSENGNKSEIISQCYALRASIGMAGHGAFKLDNMSYQGDKDIVYWHDKYNNVWTTDNRYFEAPSFATEYDTIANFIKTYPHGWKNHHGDTVTENKKNWAILLGSPAEARMEGEMFRRTLEEYIIKKGKHNDGYTDLAYVTLKATDSTGHHFGWESLESRETFTETDKQVGLIFEMLKKNYGDKFIMIITADHGCAPLPEISGGKRLTIDKFFEEIHSLLPEGNTDSLINYATIGQISLNKEMLKKHNISEEEVRNKIKMISVDGKPFFKEVILKSELNTK